MFKKRIAVFASGTGSNALNLINFFSTRALGEVSFVLTNKADAPIVEAADNLGVKVYVLSNQEVEKGEKVIELCQSHRIDLIVLAGFLRKISSNILSAYPNRIVNIHPSLLPKYGGKGMYGKHVHEAVLAAGENQSGITVHWVNEQYDEGGYLAQFYCSLNSADNLDSLVKKINQLELHYYPTVVEHCLKIIS